MIRGRRKRRALRIGLTGPIGCGKSTVARWLGVAGAAVVDADVVAREVTRPGQPALASIAETFGRGVIGPDGALDRVALAAIVFADPDRLRALEAIVHPAVRPRLVEELEAAEAAGAEAVVIEAIRLVEGGVAELCDEVWLLTCDAQAQRDRLAGRGEDEADARRRIGAQAGMAERLAPAASRIIDTSGPADDVHEAVLAALADALARDGAEG